LNKSKNDRQIIDAIKAVEGEKPRPLHKYEAVAIGSKFKKARWEGLDESLEFCNEFPVWRAYFLAVEVS